MPRYIDVDKAIVEIAKELFTLPSTKLVFSDILRRTPTADVAEVKHGEWELDWEEIIEAGKMKPKITAIYCSVCNVCSDNIYSYCPHCGAKMGGKE